MRQLTHLFLMTIITAAAVGCAAIEQKQQQQTLDDTLRIYGNAIRWGQFGLAEKFVVTPDGVTPGSPAEFAGIRITAYDVQEKTIDEKGDFARVAARIQFIHEDRASVYTVMDHQQWRFGPEEKRWLLHGRLPDLRAALRK